MTPVRPPQPRLSSHVTQELPALAGRNDGHNSRLRYNRCR